MDFNFSDLVTFFHNNLYDVFEIKKEYFAKIMELFKLDEDILVAVSGGADSLALILLLNDWKIFTNKKIKISAVTVNHMLRKESENECNFTKNLLSNFKINHETLFWHHEKINSRLEERAREARYSILIDYAKKNNYTIIMTGHQANDQIETFLMRLKRGASRGLSGIQMVRKIKNLFDESLEFEKNNQIKIIRPLLYLNPESLKLTLKKVFNVFDFVNDQHNFDLTFERVRLRKFLKEEFSFVEKKNILQTTLFLSEENYNIKKNTETFFNEYFRDIKILMKKNKSLVNKNSKIFSFKLETLFNENLNLNYSKLREILESLSDQKKTCSHRIIRNLYNKIIAHDFKKGTAHNCLIEKSKNIINFSKENR